MRSMVAIAAVLVLTTAAGAAEDSVPATPTATEILRLVDANVSVDAKHVMSRMVVFDRRGRERTLHVESWVVGTTKAFSEYLAPPKDKGTKMLKVDKNLWTYIPAANRIIHIAGHLLRQPVMGSDLSYEDSLEEASLVDDYVAGAVETAEFEGRQVWVMTITAKRDDVAYPTKKLWIDQERYIPLRQEWYAKSGKLLKTATVQKVERLDERWYPTNVLFKDELKAGRGTSFIIDSIDFSPPIPDRLFTKQSLRR